ncbi:MAG: hypothetical protein EYC70_10155 [Planctomycetota bacterium]|nr:MAG: hypothetical protein EYC70_10155 [Planctomycetota bacterium]
MDAATDPAVHPERERRHEFLARELAAYWPDITWPDTPGVRMERATPGHAELTNAAFNRVFGQERPVSHHRWKFWENPAGPSVGFLAFEESSGLLAACCIAITKWARVDGRDQRILMYCETFSDPQRRMGGRAFRAVGRAPGMQAAREGTLIGYGSQSSDDAIKIGRRWFGYRVLMSLRTWEKRLSLRPALRARFGRAGAAAAAVANAPLRRLRPRPASSLDMEPRARFGPEFDELWLDLRDQYRVLLRRDDAALTWRYVRCPVAGHHVLLARRGPRPAGYLVWREWEREGVRLATVLDLFTPRDPEPARALLAAAEREADRRDCDFIQFAPWPRTPGFAALKGLRGWRRSRREALDRVISLPLPLPAPTLEQMEVQWAAIDARNWLFTQGDSDFYD